MTNFNDDFDGMEKEHLELQELLEADVPMEEIDEEEEVEICTCDFADETLCPLHCKNFYEEDEA